MVKLHKEKYICQGVTWKRTTVFNELFSYPKYPISSLCTSLFSVDSIANSMWLLSFDSFWIYVRETNLINSSSLWFPYSRIWAETLSSLRIQWVSDSVKLIKWLFEVQCRTMIPTKYWILIPRTVPSRWPRDLEAPIQGKGLEPKTKGWSHLEGLKYEMIHTSCLSS